MAMRYELIVAPRCEVEATGFLGAGEKKFIKRGVEHTMRVEVWRCGLALSVDGAKVARWDDFPTKGKAMAHDVARVLREAYAT